MKRKSRKIDTSHKRCKELQKFLSKPSYFLGGLMDGHVFTVEGVYRYGKYRKK